MLVRSVIVFELLWNVVSCLYIGDLCTDKKTQEIGKCIVLSKCSSALQSIRNGMFPTTCGFDNTTPIVCCLNQTSPTFTTTVKPTFIEASTQTAINNENESTGPGNISRAKCEEYSKYVFKRELSPILLTDAEYIQVDTCGANSDLLITDIAKRREFPHMALIGYTTTREENWQCAGALISDRFILTSASCVHSSTHGYARHVRIGDSNFQYVEILEVIKHPNYDPIFKQNDVGLINLVRPVEINEFVRPACLSTTDLLENQKGLVSGWGSLYQNGKIDQYLRRRVVLSANFKVCNDTYGVKKAISARSQFCAISEVDVCVADKGGPVQQYSKEFYCMYNVVGVISLWENCAREGKPALVTKVSNYIDWIEKNVSF